MIVLVSFPTNKKSKLKDIAFSGFRSYSRPGFLHTQDDIETLNDLKNNKSIVIMKPDKGNDGVVILSKSDCSNKMDTILPSNVKIKSNPC